MQFRQIALVRRASLAAALAAALVTVALSAPAAHAASPASRVAPGATHASRQTRVGIHLAQAAPARYCFNPTNCYVPR